MDLTNSWDKSSAGKSRRVPTWAAKLVDALARDRPPVLTHELLADYLEEVGSPRSPEATERELRRLGWLCPLPIKGAWAFVAPGEEALSDPYIELRGWRQRDPRARFLLAGEAAAWHLGYLPRFFNGVPAVWIPADRRLPHGLRARLAVVRVDWPVHLYAELAPTESFLEAKGLDQSDDLQC
ncbi:MAG: type IV toxin-antitoxin system AbiEi family antitoxin, partial [Acidimicrobiales bacterium]